MKLKTTLRPSHTYRSKQRYVHRTRTAQNNPFVRRTPTAKNNTLPVAHAPLKTSLCQSHTHRSKQHFVRRTRTVQTLISIAATKEITRF
jgi:hypothetical protein